MSAMLNQSLRDLSKSLRATLIEAQGERDSRPALVETNGEMLCEWAVYERAVMHTEVNRIRTEAELAEVPLKAVIAVERQALGHSDYTSKFAFFCAELALDCSPIWKPATGR